MLEKKGFQIVPHEASADTVVVYRLRSFKFGVERSWPASSNAVAVLAVDARRNALSYNTVYRAHSEDVIFVVPAECATVQQMNGVLSEN